MEYAFTVERVDWQRRGKSPTWIYYRVAGGRIGVALVGTPHVGKRRPNKSAGTEACRYAMTAHALFKWRRLPALPLCFSQAVSLW